MNFEILLSTREKTNLDFLKAIFEKNKLENIDVLIVNQTGGKGDLISDIPNVRVINSAERGSPQSRNLAIKNARGEICLFADDDIIYYPGFKDIILDAHLKNKEADIITFEATDADGKRYLRYPPPGKYEKNKFRVNTYVISFKRESVQKTGTVFNPHFGVGSTFGGSTEFLFMSNAWENELSMLHISSFIAQHPEVSSGKKQGSDDAVASRAALRYRLYGWLAYPWVMRYAFNMVRFKYIRPSEIFRKIKIGFKAIGTYKQLQKEGNMP